MTVSRISKTSGLVSPEKAAEYLAFNNFPGQRPINQRRVDVLIDLIRSGKWRDGQIALIRVAATKERYLINGQKTLTAIVQANRSAYCSVSSWSCDTMEEALHEFALYDNPSATQPRTPQNITNIVKYSLNGEMDTPLMELTRIGAALQALDGGTIPNFASRANFDNRIEQLKSNGDMIRFASQWPDHEFEHFRRIGVTTAIIATARVVGEKRAFEFWDGVATGENLARTDPRKRLRDVLMSGKFQSNGGQGFKKEIYCHCVKWFNAWNTGREMKFARFSSTAEIPAIKASR